MNAALGRKLLLVALLLFAIGFLPYPEILRKRARVSDPAARRYAFIGNSLTFTYDIPGLVQKFSRNEEGVPIETVDFSRPGWPLIWHRDRGTLSQLEGVSWRGVVIQEQSWESLHAPERARESILAIGSEIQKRGIRGYLFESSIGSWTAAERAQVQAFFRSVAAEGSLELLPVTSAWELLAHTPYGFPTPFGPDNHHPSFFGSFSAALVILQGLQGRPLQNIPCREQLPLELLWHLLISRWEVALSEEQCTALRQVVTKGAFTDP